MTTSEIECLNGKLDELQSLVLEHNRVHEEDMKLMMPVILDYQQKKQDADAADRAGKKVLKYVGVFTAVGTAWLILKQIWPNFPHL